MNKIAGHLYRCFLAGLVALLPIGGTIFAIVYMETTISSSWLAGQPFYFPGCGLLAVAVSIYIIGLAVSTFLGKFIWKRVDSLIDRLPALGSLYQTLKQILGYGKGDKAIFHYVVLVESPDGRGDEIGLVTNELKDGAGNDKLVVFIPGVPTPTSGRLIIVAADRVRRLDISVTDALKSLISVGKTALSLEQPKPE